MRTKLLLLISIVLGFMHATMAQAPQLLNYQAVVRNRRGSRWPVCTWLIFSFKYTSGSKVAATWFLPKPTQLPPTSLAWLRCI